MTANSFVRHKTPPWYKQWQFWLRAVLVAFTITLFGTITAPAGSPISVATSATTENVFYIVSTATLWIGMLTTGIGIILQYHKLIPGIITVTVGLSLVALSFTFVLFPGYLLLCYETWFIASRVTKNRIAWATTIAIGAISTLVLHTVTLLIPALSEPNSLVQFYEPRVYLALIGVTVLTAVSLFLLYSFWIMGTNVYRRTQKIAELSAQVELAALTERNRIAREMHDIIAHSLTTVIAQADGGRYAAAKNPELAVQALSTISEVSRHALSQMRSLLTVLRDPAEIRSPEVNPGIENLKLLIRDAENSGLNITFNERGVRIPISQELELTIYRVIQEALTNALKHAGKVPVQITMDWQAQSDRSGKLVLTIDSAANQNQRTQIPGSGSGLRGISERAKLHGGSAVWMPSKKFPNGFNLTVTLPYEMSRDDSNGWLS